MNDDSAPGGAAGEAIRRYWPMVYAPTAIFSMGEGAIMPVLPAIAAGLGADLAVAALIAAMLIVGQLCGNLPAGWLVARAGERRAMIIAAAVSLIGIAVMLSVPLTVTLGAGAFIVGMSASVLALARHAFMTTRAPRAYRARALALVGGSFRLGAFTGPLVAAALIWLTGSEYSTIWFFAVCVIAMGILVAFGPDPEERALKAEREARRASRDASDAEVADTGEPVSEPIPQPARVGVLRTIVEHRTVLSRLGLAAAALASVRAGRQVMLPLWGVSIGLGSDHIALVVGIAGAVEFSLFYASGQVMDRFGRIWATVPSLSLMGVAFVALACTHDVDSAATWFTVLAIVLGLGNGLSSGALMTLGADVAPQRDPAPFLGAWRTLSDAGSSATPLMVAGVTAIASLPLAVGIVGAIGLLGVIGFLRWVPRFAPR